MAQRVYQIAFNITGAQAADHVFTWKVPFACQIIHVSMSNSTANAGTLDLGPAADADGYLNGATFGVSAACTEIAAFADFDGAVSNGQFPKVADGTVLHVTIIDHASNMADSCVVITFTEG